MKLQKVLLWLMSLLLAASICGCKDEDNNDSELEYKIVEDKLFKSTGDNTWEYVGKVLGDSVSNSQFRIEGTNLMVSLDGISWRPLGKVVGENGLTPMFDIKEGYWCISYDSGKTWENIGKATIEVSPNDTLVSNSAICSADSIKGKIFYRNYGDFEGQIYEFNKNGKCYKTYYSIEYSYGALISSRDTFDYFCDGNAIYEDGVPYPSRLLSDGTNFFYYRYEISSDMSKDALKWLLKYDDNNSDFGKEINRATMDSIIKAVEDEAKRIEEEYNNNTANIATTAIQVQSGRRYVALLPYGETVDFIVLQTQGTYSNKNQEVVILIDGVEYALSDTNNSIMIKDTDGYYKVVSMAYAQEKAQLAIMALSGQSSTADYTIISPSLNEKLALAGAEEVKFKEVK